MHIEQCNQARQTYEIAFGSTGFTGNHQERLVASSASEAIEIMYQRYGFDVNITDVRVVPREVAA